MSMQLSENYYCRFKIMTKYIIQIEISFSAYIFLSFTFSPLMNLSIIYSANRYLWYFKKNFDKNYFHGLIFITLARIQLHIKVVL